MKIHIVGASCSGVTTLGQVLSAETMIPYFDSDHYFWEKSDTPYAVRRNDEQRNRLLQHDLIAHEDWIVGGSIFDWGADLSSVFDLVIFLWIPQDLRIRRLKHREFERYGKVIFTDEERRKKYKTFIEWAAGYDDGTARGRTLEAHEHWINSLSCPVLELRGDMTVEKRMVAVMKEINKIWSYNPLDHSIFSA